MLEERLSCVATCLLLALQASDFALVVADSAWEVLLAVLGLQVVHLLLRLQEGALGFDEGLCIGGSRLLSSRYGHSIDDVHEVLRLLSPLVPRGCKLLLLNVSQTHARYDAAFATLLDHARRVHLKLDRGGISRCLVRHDRRICILL